MRKSARRILFTLLLLETGCGKDSEAAPRQVPAPAGERSSALAAPGTTTSTASAVPGASAGNERTAIDLEAIQIAIEEIDDGLGDGPRREPEGALVPLSLKIKVTSNQESPRPRVDFRRFSIRANNGDMFSARPSTSKEPALVPTYLKKGASVSGWLTFEVPITSLESFLLWSDLRNPPIQVNVRLSTPQ